MPASCGWWRRRSARAPRCRGWPTATPSSSWRSPWRWPAPPGRLTADPIRAVAVLVVATPCPLILAVPVAIVVRAVARGQARHPDQGRQGDRDARRPCARWSSTRPARSPSARPSWSTTRVADTITPDELLRLAASLDQASKHIIAQTSSPQRAPRGSRWRSRPRWWRRRARASAARSRAAQVVVGGLRYRREQDRRRRLRGLGRRAATRRGRRRPWRSTASRPAC